MAAYNKLQLANEALSLIEANLISSFDDGTNEANSVNLWYGSFIDDVFSSNYWRFAINTKQLSQDAGYDKPMLSYTQAFIIPAECQVVLGCFLPNSDSPFKRWTRVGAHILTNAAELVAQFTTYPAEETWPGYFKSFAAYALAAKIAKEITGSVEIAMAMKAEAYGPPNTYNKGGRWADAASKDAMAYPKHEVLMNELLIARFN